MGGCTAGEMVDFSTNLWDNVITMEEARLESAKSQENIDREAEDERLFWIAAAAIEKTYGKYWNRPVNFRRVKDFHKSIPEMSDDEFRDYRLSRLAENDKGVCRFLEIIAQGATEAKKNK